MFDKERAEGFFKKEGIHNLSTVEGECNQCGDPNTEETFFSSSRCECCGGLPGDRYHATAWHEESKQVFCYEVCPECIYYAAYGEALDS